MLEFWISLRMCGIEVTGKIIKFSKIYHIFKMVCNIYLAIANLNYIIKCFSITIWISNSNINKIINNLPQYLLLKCLNIPTLLLKKSIHSIWKNDKNCKGIKYFYRWNSELNRNTMISKEFCHNFHIDCLIISKALNESNNVEM